MKHVIAEAFFFSTIFLLAGCGAFSAASGEKGRTKEPVIFTAAVWNVQSLFDGQETGREYSEYLESAGWTAEKYAARITAISQAVLHMPELAAASQPVQTDSASRVSVPDLIGLVELENAGVLNDIAHGSLSKYGFFWTAFANLPGSPLGVGFLSRVPLKEARAHSITIGKDTAPRPVLEVRIEERGKPLVFLLCHWKSKLGGDIATETQRRASARVVQRRIQELKETEAGTPVIVMGDLNENNDEFFRHSGKLLCALLPDDPGAAALVERSTGALKECLVLSGDKPPRTSSFPEEACVLYSPWRDEMDGGSYYYKGEWETIDHFLLSDGLFNGSGWNFASCRVLNHDPFTGSDGAPNPYVPRNGRGLSDHLPLLLCLRDSDGE